MNHIDPPRFWNVASWLPEMAALQPDHPAVIQPDGRERNGDPGMRTNPPTRPRWKTLTARGLELESNRFARALERAGVRRGMRVVLMVTPSLEFFALTFALFKIGAVIVMVDPGIGVKNLGKCLGEAEPEAFVGVGKAHLARRLFGWARRSLRVLVSVNARLAWGGSRLRDLIPAADDGVAPYPPFDAAPDDVAAILFTSGSTGVPKGAVYTHGIFAWQVKLLREMFGIEPGEMDLGTFPLFALFGPALGMTSVIPEMDATRPAKADPRKLMEAIESHGVTQMFGSPALIDRLGRYGAECGRRIPTLRRAMSAGAPVMPGILERFRAMIPESAEVWTPYGATESLPVAAIESREILGETRALTEAGRGVCVGRPAPCMEVRIIRIDDGPIARWSEDLVLPAGEIGEIVVKGPVVTREYFRRDDQTALAKIRDDGPEVSEGAPSAGSRPGIRHRMGDVGYLDEKGRLWFCGRKSHRVVTAEGTLFSAPVEEVFNAHPRVFRSALVGVGERGRQTPVLWVELEKVGMQREDEAVAVAAYEAGSDRGTPARKLPRTYEEVVRAELLELAARHETTRTIRTILFHPAFPVDIRHNAKIGREKLAVEAARRFGRG